jgi:predicted DCC family thiol-disulfide oxidoreductase YuxK
VARTGGPLTVLYDGECGFCAWALAWVLRWDRRRALRPVAIQSEQGARLLADLSEERRLASWHVCDQHGERRSGAAALEPALRRLPGGRPPAALVAAFPRAAEAAYGWVARHRVGRGWLATRRARRRARALIAARMH